MAASFYETEQLRAYVFWQREIGLLIQIGQNQSE